MDLLDQRIKGVLPSIEIAGKDYTIDIRLNELREKERPWSKLLLEDMVKSADDKHYLFFYDINRGEIIHASPKMVQVPKHAVLVEIPDELGLDPVGLARKYGLDDRYFLKEQAYRNQITAKLTPLKDSGLVEYVKQNQRAELKVKK